MPSDASYSGPVLLLPLQKGAPGFQRVGHGWATTAGVLDDGKLRPTFDREGERMQAAETPHGIDFSQLLPSGYMNDSHRAVAAPGAVCHTHYGCTSTACAVHGGKRWSVLIGIPDSLEYVDAQHPLADRDGKIGWYSHFHLIDPADQASWRNPDGSDRMRMARDGTVLDTPYAPTPEELDRASTLWNLGLKLQREGRTIGQSIQGRETAVPCEGGKKIIRALAHQIALIEYPHNPDATVEGLGNEMAKGEAPVVVTFAELLWRNRARYGIETIDAALRASRKVLKDRGVYKA